MPTFFDRFSELCKENGETPNSLGRKLGIPSGSITAWKKGTIPRMKTLDLLARHFHVSVDYLIGNVNDPFFYLDNERIIKDINSYEDDEKAPVLTEKDQRDIARGTDETKKKPTQEGELNRNMIDPAFFRVMQDANDRGYTPEDIQMALDFLDRARRRDQK